MSRMYSPSPSVAAWRTPYYLRGVGLGDDLMFADSSPDIPTSVDFGTIDAPNLVPAAGPVTSPGFFTPSNPDLQPLIDQGFSADTADLISSAAAGGAISSAQFNQILAGHMSEGDIENLILGSGNFGPAATPISKTGSSASSTGTNIVKAAIQAVQPAHPTVPNLGPGASPRVATPAVAGSSFLTQSNIIPGVPNVGILIGGGLLLMLAMGRK
jgi:hypothetical protein